MSIRPQRVLLAEDDRALGMLLKRALTADGHEVELATSGNAAIIALHQQSPDLAIIDLGLPESDGSHVLKILRSISTNTPALVLTGDPDLDLRLRCFGLGADDCMLKPFSLRELRARCSALLRRNSGAATVLRYADLELNRLDHSVSRSGTQVELTNKEYDLLECLMLHQGKCVSRALLMERVWKSEASANANVVDVYINYLRRKLNELGEPNLIATVRGEGYRMGTLPQLPAQASLEVRV